MDGFEFVDKIPNWLRWILFIPMPIIIARIVIVLGSFCTNLVIGGGFEVESSSWFYSTLFIMYDNAMTPMIMGISGFIIAPKKKFICGLIQALIWGLFVVASLCIAVTYSIMSGDTASLASWEAVKLYMMAIIGLISVVYISVEMFKLEKEGFTNLNEKTYETF
ncbi:hypothetical protein [Desulfosporosinus metallidurans]|uniref:Uncharacterized protein n=1 Tax=Desulfosporosinus metallidurans TaxID=1888891 RepID=A0A1Q8R0Z8_9FIRM|nr:hypothetical protein [Desulfosporosinus metallidurans]OLN33287.1 hypothetical protein DSOL_0533 [Desulfosporosinus metallidurans]